MLKSGVIFGIIAFVFTLFNLPDPCALCFTLLFGLGAGYMAGIYDRPLENNESLKIGAGAGALAGGLMIPAQLIVGSLSASTGQIPGGDLTYQLIGEAAVSDVFVWGAQLVVSCCVGLFSLALMAGAGAGGSALWFRRRSQAGTDEPIPPAI